MSEFEKIDVGMYVFKGAVNAGVLMSDGKVLLIDCCDMLPDALQSFAGTYEVDMILFTQHRRPNTCGAYRWSGSDARIIVPENEKHLFDKVEEYWEDPGNRMHLYHHQPSDQILPRSIDVSDTVRDEDVILWGEFGIRILETPGATDGSVSYLISKGGRSWCFCGDLIFGDDDCGYMDGVAECDVDAGDSDLHVGDATVDGTDDVDALGKGVSVETGKLWDIYSLQKGDGCMDYHGYMGNWKKLCTSLERILAQKPDGLIPSHGSVILNPEVSAKALMKKLSALYGNYASISSMNHYFPGFFEGKTESKDRMIPAKTFAFPEFIKPVGYTSSLILSETGDGFLVDCGNGLVADNLRSLQEAGALKSLESCWVTHYHDDHTDALDMLAKDFHCGILACSVMKDVVENPGKYHLPCLSPVSIKVKGLEHGIRWHWNEYELTALHFPGQTFYHGGLLVEKEGVKVLFAGDSFSPAGIDDYCSGNRNFSGKERGFRYCIDLIRDLRPDFIINQHQDKAFRFSNEQLDYMDRALAEREKLLSAIMPWDSPDFGTDESWVTAYPYWQAASPGSEITVNVHFTNHGEKSAKADAVPLTPDRWKLVDGAGGEGITILPRNSRPSPVLKDHDGSIGFKFLIPVHESSKTVVIPLQIWWNGKCLGQIRHALVKIT
jgi:glyoxylase-like metal-dependent hydrolase (beta-lactamase superfamily II)